MLCCIACTIKFPHHVTMCNPSSQQMLLLFYPMLKLIYMTEAICVFVLGTIHTTLCTDCMLCYWSRVLGTSIFVIKNYKVLSGKMLLGRFQVLIFSEVRKFKTQWWMCCSAMPEIILLCVIGRWEIKVTCFLILSCFLKQIKWINSAVGNNIQFYNFFKNSIQVLHNILGELSCVEVYVCPYMCVCVCTMCVVWFVIEGGKPNSSLIWQSE